MFSELQIFRIVRLRHQRAVLAAGQAVFDPGRVFVAGNAYAVVKRTAAQPAEEDRAMG
jgi:hypothetical protein